MSHAKQILKQKDPKKGSVRFDAKSSDKHPLFASVYLLRDGAEKLLGISKLDKASAIEISVRVVKDSENDEDEDENEDE